MAAWPRHLRRSRADGVFRSRRCRIQDQLPKAYADQDRVKQIIDNLIGNAIKFTEKGSITVSAEVKNSQIVVSVHDTGRSMSPRDQKTLFKRFQQIRSEDVTNGSGLGLYISKQLVEDMGGKIWVDYSTPEKGTAICFSLKIYASHKEPLKIISNDNHSSKS